MINKSNADTYFQSHPRGHSWSAFSDPDREAAIVHAKRLLSRMVRDGLIDETTTDGDFPRHDLAVYEQALWLLQQSPSMRDGNVDAPIPEATDTEEADGVRQAQSMVVAPEARRWIARDGTAVIYAW